MGKVSGEWGMEGDEGKREREWRRKRGRTPQSTLLP